MRLLLALVLAAASSLACSGHRPAAVELPASEAPTAAVWSRWELSLDLVSDAVEARFTTPSGRVDDVGGFASRGMVKVRYTPREVGPHAYVVRAGGREIARGRLVAAPARGSRGFVRRDPVHERRLVADDGTTVFILGENRINVYDPTWNYENASIPDYVARMRGYGMSTIRVFLFSDCESETVPGGHQIGCLEPEVGEFDERTAEAIDVLFDAAERNGVDVVLVAFALGFSPPPETWRSWEDNPYSALVKTAQDFFTSPVAREHAKQRLRYIANRWAASPRLLAIDLLNEPEWDGEIPEDVWIPWGEEMSRAWRTLDPYGHLVTIGSVGLHENVGAGDERTWYDSSANDLVQWHLYGAKFYDPNALAIEMTRKVQETWVYDKPIFCGEFGYGGEAKPAYEHTHAGIWSLLMSGAGALAHSAPPFEIDSDEPMTPERALHFQALSRFLATVDANKALTPVMDVRVPSHGVRAWSLVTDDRADRLVWLLAGAGVTRVEGARMFFRTPSTRLRVTWIDDVTGAIVSSSAIEAIDGEAVTSVPAFERHIAARIAAE